MSFSIKVCSKLLLYSNTRLFIIGEGESQSMQVLGFKQRGYCFEVTIGFYEISAS